MKILPFFLPSICRSCSVNGLRLAVSIGSMACTVGAADIAAAAGLTGADLEEVTVVGRRIALSGEPRAASEGTVLREQLESRPLLRVGELLEVVPGMIVTQHTGDGKANQYFLRGFNLDHGTDFSTRVEGMPVNMPTHAHGQGYMDLNFVIPELVGQLVYRKGTYYPELGNFSAAGAADIRYLDSIAEPFVSLTWGDQDFFRAVAGGSIDVAGGALLAGLEVDRTDGPWVNPENLKKTNGVLRWSRTGENAGLAVDVMGYSASWDSTDQIPQRAVAAGQLDRFGAIDTTTGGESSRYSVSLQGFGPAADGRLDYSAYAIDYDLRLYSNFTYFLDEVNGDQFAQFDDRRVYGGALTWSRALSLGAEGSTLRVGADVRHDDIDPVGLYLSRERERYATVREDSVSHTLTGLWTGFATRWAPWLRTELGARFDRLDYDVRSDLAENSGSGNDSLTSPKLSIALGPWADTEYFVAAGRGFHSNDVRGATIEVDPADPTCTVAGGCLSPVTALVPATGYEVGARTALLPRTQLSIALWRLDLDSELLFVGDGGATEPTRASRREGVELGLYARPTDALIVDADYAWTRPRFRDDDPTGDRIPGAIESAASLGITGEWPNGFFAGARVRYLGPAALVEDDSVRSESTTLVNVQAGYRWSRFRVTVALFNALDEEANDITYFYESRLAGEAAPVEDVHFHPVEPRSVRVTLEGRF
jgi:hypothetical protein